MIKDKQLKCPVCKKRMIRIGETTFLGLETGKTYGHPKCNTMLTLVNPGCDKFFGRLLIGTSSD